VLGAELSLSYNSGVAFGVLSAALSQRES